ncbi:N-acetylglucosamine-1-phosphate uridyltransferase / Glucosamine-1-phosphate N-acetyltransferase [hydrothermal vent metagenome]|uniref:UDP-N-acetylglucosamine diphosphorylase n=1 Tax=hydrothermal vent metagenome TaxID=652676 RepID=A0A3B1DV99_9ZZZZ
MTKPIAIILAAGRGTRMKSDLPKVVHTIHNRPMVEYVIDAARNAGVEKLILVVGYQADVVKEALSHRTDVEYAVQTEQKGTGHAVMMCEPLLQNHDGPVLVLAGDTPLLKSASLSGLLNAMKSENACCVIGTAETSANEGLGRIVRDAKGDFVKIVEQKDASSEEQQITEINTGCYGFAGKDLLWSLEKIEPINQQGEYYLTDCPRLLQSAGKNVVASCQFDIQEAMGVNTTDQLDEIAKHLTES